MTVEDYDLEYLSNTDIDPVCGEEIMQKVPELKPFLLCSGKCSFRMFIREIFKEEMPEFGKVVGPVVADGQYTCLVVEVAPHRVLRVPIRRSYYQRNLLPPSFN